METQKVDFSALFVKVRENRDKLDACKCHKFADEVPGIGQGVGAMFGKKMACAECGGYMDLIAINYYVRGYEAHGGDGNDILPGWREEPKKDGNGRRFFGKSSEET